MITLTLLCCLLLSLFAFVIIKRRSKGQIDGKLPPGPKGLPIIGNLLQLDKALPFLKFDEWAKEYGPIYRVHVGSSMTYIVSDPKLVKDMFSLDPAFAGRMDLKGINDVYGNGTIHGIINTEGEHWEQLRRFTLRQLRDFGFGKQAMETLIMDELKEVLDWLKENEGKPIEDIKHKMSVAVVNSLWTVISGHRFKHDDPFVQHLTRMTTVVLEDMAKTGGVVFFAPWLRHFIPEWSGFNAIRKVMDGFRTMFAGAMEEHKKTYSDEYQRDFIDAFLKEIRSTTDKDSAFYGDLGEHQLVGTISDLFLAGSDTTSTTLDWIFFYLATFPNVQKKLQAELDSVVGNSRHCSLSDRSQLPYAEAFIAETMRYSSITPMSVGHRSLADRTFQGYAVPKDTVIMASLYSMHHSKSIWGDPEAFRPERFLTSEGKFKKNDALLPFSIGRRQCAGETLARDTLFLYTTNIFHRFGVKFDGEGSNPGMKPRPGFMLNPKAYTVQVFDRM